MRAKKKSKLKAAGWKVGTVSEFLDLTPEEEALIEMKLALAEFLRKRRHKEKITQTELATLLGSSQSRVAKMEAADSAVSLDLLVRGLLVLGVSPKQLARVIGTTEGSKAA